jgi:hypothetical protein
MTGNGCTHSTPHLKECLLPRDMEGEAITVYMNESHDMFPLLTSPFLLPEAGNSVKHPDWPLSAPLLIQLPATRTE